MFRRLKQRGRNSGSAEPQVTFAAFGKHPGWDDHMPDMGGGTETLASLKQNVYVSGIGGQIDSGAWERLEPEKRIEGFDHTFLWLTGAHAILGQLWSSTDRKGRAKYPMAVCVELVNVPFGLLLAKPRQILDQVRDGVRDTTSADHVILESRAAQDQLSAWLNASGAAKAYAEPSPELKIQFLDHPALGPDSIGLLRVLHELDNATGRSRDESGKPQSAATLRAYHIRVPRCAESLDQALLLWASFLRSALPEVAPLLLIARHTTDWLDVILGPPASDDFFCLQASLQALPLATAIPYDIAPDLRRRLQQVRGAFLGSAHPGESTERFTSATTVLAPAPPSPNTSPAPRRPIALTIGALVLVAGCLALGFWWRSQHPAVVVSHNENSPPPPPQNVVNTNVSPPGTEDQTAADLRKREEQTAADLRKQEEHDKAAAAYQAALAAARQALDRGEFSNAIAQADSALALRQEPEASKLKAVAQAELRFQTLLKTAQAAFDRGDDAETLKQADAALAIHEKAEQATKLKQMAEQRHTQKLANQERDANFERALNAGRAALDRRDFPQAIAQANAALGIKSAAPEATRLKSAAQQELAYGQASAAFAGAEYEKSLSLCQPYRGTERFDGLVQQVGQEQNQLKALQKAFYEGDYAAVLAPGLPAKAPFGTLKSQAVEESRLLQEAKQKLAEGQYGFVEQIEHQSCKTKPPFLSLLETARRERDALTTLQAARKADQSEAVREDLAKLSPEVRRKKPFADLDEWSRRQQAEVTPQPQPSPKPPVSSTTANYENVLHALEIRFGLKPEERGFQDRDGNVVKRETNLSKAKRVEAAAKVRFLKEYHNDGWLTEDHKARLQKLDEAIRNWKE